MDAATRAVGHEPDTARPARRPGRPGRRRRRKPDRCRPLGQDGLLQGHQVLRLDRIGRMVGEVAVELREEDVDGEREPLEDDRHDQATHAIGCVGHHLERPQRRHVDEGDDVIGPLVEQVQLATSPGERARGLVEQLFRRDLDLAQPRVAPDRTRAREAHLQPVVLSRVVRRGEHGARSIEVTRGEVEEVGRRHPQIRDVDALGPHPVREGRRQLDARLTHVATHQYLGGAGKAGHGTPDGIAHCRIELVGHRPRTS